MWTNPVAVTVDKKDICPSTVRSSHLWRTESELLQKLIGAFTVWGKAMWVAFVNRCLIVNCLKGGITQVYVQNLKLDLPILVMRGALIKLLSNIT